MARRYCDFRARRAGRFGCGRWSVAMEGRSFQLNFFAFGVRAPTTLAGRPLRIQCSEKRDATGTRKLHLAPPHTLLDYCTVRYPHRFCSPCRPHNFSTPRPSRGYAASSQRRDTANKAQRRGEALRVNISAGEGLQQVWNVQSKDMGPSDSGIRCLHPTWDPAAH